MASKRNKKGEIVAGNGSSLTTLQSEFLNRVSEEGLDASSKIAKELNYTSYYRDRRNQGTAFHRELMALANSMSIGSNSGGRMVSLALSQPMQSTMTRPPSDRSSCISR